MKLPLLITLFVAYTSAVSYYDVMLNEWETWKIQHGKTYNSDEEEHFRFKIFMENKEFIAKHNLDAHQGLKNYFLKLNAYGDLLHHEFVSTMNGYKPGNKPLLKRGFHQILPANVDLPTDVDWRKKGAVTEVKNQGQCGSCWAFSTTGSLEGQHYRKTGKLVSLSEQNILDCSREFAPQNLHGCDGGDMDDAFRFIKANGGIDTEKGYPYTMYEGNCLFNASDVAATDKGYVDVKEEDEDALKAAVATVGPISVAIDASGYEFQHYWKGVYDESTCKNDLDHLNHAVLAVGYGTYNGPYGNPGDYWLVKNSWGSSWGDRGYIKMARNKNNFCGIATCASYPVV